MWRVDLICRQEAEPHFESTVVTERSPYLVAVKNGDCPICKRRLTVVRAVDMRPREYNIRKKKVKLGGFKAEQRELF